MKANSAASQNHKVGCSHRPCKNSRLNHLLRHNKATANYDLRRAVEDAHAFFFAKRSISIRSLQ